MTLKPAILAFAAAGVLLIAVPPALARGPSSISMLGGRCESLIVANRSQTARCRPELIAISYGGSDVSFVLAGSDGRLVSFKGRAGHATAIQTTLKVTQVTTVGKGAARAVKVPVVGSCVYTRFARTANRLECAVSGRAGRYAAAFVTDGKEPTRLSMR